MNKIAILIDDDDDDLNFLKEAIEFVDPLTTCMTFNDPQKALDHLFHGQDELPYFVFIDINMLNMMGDICLQVLRGAKQFKNVTIGILSTAMNENTKHFLLKAGANFAYAKPNTMDGYIDLLRTIY